MTLNTKEHTVHAEHTEGHSPKSQTVFFVQVLIDAFLYVLYCSITKDIQ